MMKKQWMLVMVAAMGMYVSGCSTSVMGPVSYQTANQNKVTATKRMIYRSEAPAEKKVDALKCLASGEDVKKAAIMVSPDPKLEYTWGEWIYNVVVGHGGDLLAYSAAGLAAKAGVDAVDGGGDTINIYNGSGNTINGNDNQINTSSSTAGGNSTSTAGGGGRQDASSGRDGTGGSNTRRSK